MITVPARRELLWKAKCQQPLWVWLTTFPRTKLEANQCHPGKVWPNACFYIPGSKMLHFTPMKVFFSKFPVFFCFRVHQFSSDWRGGIRQHILFPGCQMLLLCHAPPASRQRNVVSRLLLGLFLGNERWCLASSSVLDSTLTFTFVGPLLLCRPRCAVHCFDLSHWMWMCLHWG